MKNIKKLFILLITVCLIGGCTLKAEYNMDIKSDKSMDFSAIMAFDEELISAMASNGDGTMGDSSLTDDGTTITDDTTGTTDDSMTTDDGTLTDDTTGITEDGTVTDDSTLTDDSMTIDDSTSTTTLTDEEQWAIIENAVSEEDRAQYEEAGYKVERYEEGSPWQAYRQFCKHFLAPLALMSYTDVRLNRLLINNIDGIPLDLAKKLLPKKAKFNFGILTHIFLHSDCQKQYENNVKALEKPVKMSKNALIALIENLKDVVLGLKFPKIKTEWGEYYSNTNYTEQSFLEKKSIISDYIEKINPKTVCDLGANRGDFSRIASDKCIKTLAFDIDDVAVEENYLQMKKLKEFDILPLLQDLTNPSPSIGFSNDERASFCSRYKSDLVMALALIHHLSISNNLPFDNTAEFFSELAQYLIIEFVPKEDSKVQILLSTREDIFPEYNQQYFETVYSKYYEILEKRNIQSSKRILYLMRRKG